MPRYRVTVRRDCPLVTEVSVEAQSEEDAERIAVKRVERHPASFHWTGADPDGEEFEADSAEEED